MVAKKDKWNPPSWPWELELITLVFFLASVLIPYYFNSIDVPATPGVRNGAETDAIQHGQFALSTQFGFLWSLGIAIVYFLQLTVSVYETSRVTASPIHLLAPLLFALVAYYRIDSLPNLQNSALSIVDGSVGQVIAMLLVVALVTSVLARLRAHRYLINFANVQWDIISKAPYDSTFLNLLMQLRPLLYAPRRYRACSEGMLVEGWFYVMPIGFNAVHAMGVMNHANTYGVGLYYASSARHLVRLELHDSLRPTYISPENREEFVRYCATHIARKRPTRKASASRHGMMHASDTHAAGDTHDRATAQGGATNGRDAAASATRNHG